MRNVITGEKSYILNNLLRGHDSVWHLAEFFN